jgi:hypothetical protein
VIAALRTFEKACALKLKRQRHGEPSGMGRSDQFLWIGTLLDLEAGS